MSFQDGSRKDRYGSFYGWIDGYIDIRFAQHTFHAFQIVVVYGINEVGISTKIRRPSLDGESTTTTALSAFQSHP